MPELIQLMSVVKPSYAVYKEGDSYFTIQVDYIGVFQGYGAHGIILDEGEYKAADSVNPMNFEGIFYKNELAKFKIGTNVIELHLDKDQRHSEMRDNMLNILNQHKGDTKVYVVDIETLHRNCFPSRYNVSISEKLLEKLKDLLGEGRVNVTLDGKELNHNEAD